VKLPTGWKLSKIGQELDLLYGKPLKKQSRSGGNIPVYGSNGIVGYHSHALVNHAGIIVGRKGSCGEIHYSQSGFFPIDTTYYVSLKHDHNLAFLFYCLRTLGLEKMNSHSAVPGLNRDVAYDVECVLPPLPEQKKIAAVLSKLQNAIDVQDQLSQSLRDLKKSTMNHLFTHGLKGEKLKKTEIGMIPQSWEIKDATSVCARVTDGTHDTPMPSDNGYFLITSKNLKGGRLNLVDTYRISEQDFDEINKRSKVDIHDIIFGMIGTIGSPVRVLPDHPTIAIKNVGLFKVGGDELLGKWLCYYLGSDRTSRYFDTYGVSRTSQKYTTLGFLRSCPIPLPRKDEQVEIVHILHSIDQKLENHESQKSAYQELFKTMLNKLMTGQIRVKNLDIDTTEVDAA